MSTGAELCRGNKKKKRNLYHWTYCRSNKTLEDGYAQQSSNKGVITEKCQVFRPAAAAASSPASPPVQALPPSLPISSRLPAHAVKSSAQQCGPLWARGLIRGGSSSRCPPLPEFQLCQRRCRGVGLNWWTSAEARNGSSGQFGDTFEFRPLRPEWSL